MPKAVNRNKHWNEDEDKTLRKALADGGFPEAVRRLAPRRSQWAVGSRMYRLGLTGDAIGCFKKEEPMVRAIDFAAELELDRCSTYRLIKKCEGVVRRGQYILIPARELERLKRERAANMHSDVIPMGYFSTPQTVEILGASKSTLRSRIYRGYYSFRKIAIMTRRGPRVYYHQDDVMAALRKDRQHGRAA